VLALLRRPTPARTRVALAILATSWALVGWAFHYRRYATINWAAEYFAIAFALEAAALVVAAMRAASAHRPLAPAGAPWIGDALLLLAIAGYPLIALLAGRGVTHVEVFGLAPDPTAVGTLGALVRMPNLARWPLAAIPLAWCAISGLTLWTMGAPDAPIAPAAALVALVALARRRRSVRVEIHDAPRSVDGPD
jgi:hypothetical protein